MVNLIYKSSLSINFIVVQNVILQDFIPLFRKWLDREQQLYYINLWISPQYSAPNPRENVRLSPNLSKSLTVSRHQKLGLVWSTDHPVAGTLITTPQGPTANTTAFVVGPCWLCRGLPTICCCGLWSSGVLDIRYHRDFLETISGFT